MTDDDTLERRTSAIFYAALEVNGYMAAQEPDAVIGEGMNGAKRTAVAAFEEDLRLRGYRVVPLQ